MLLNKLFPFFIAILTSAAAFSSEYVRLVPASPPTLPTTSTTLLKSNSAILAYSLVNDASMKYAINNKWKEQLPTWISMAEEAGQPGILLSVRMVKIQVGSVTNKQLLGDGLWFHGIGPSPQDVCYTKKCYILPLEPIPAGGFVIDEASEYVWIEKDLAKRGVQVSRYSISELEGYVRTAALDENLRADFERLSTARSMNAYAQSLSDSIKSAADKKTVSDLLLQRESALRRQGEIEENLARQQERLARLQRAQSRLELMSQIFSTISTLALSSATSGVPLKSSSASEAAQEIAKSSADIYAEVLLLNKQQATEAQSIRNVDAKLKDIGATKDLKGGFRLKLY